MKLRITIQDLEALNESQKAHLSDLWLPEKYDLAAAIVCTNAVEEKYELIEFVVGAIKLHRDGAMTLYDLAALPKPGEDSKEDFELQEREIPDVSHGTGPFSSIDPLTGAYNGKGSPFSKADKDTFMETDSQSNDDEYEDLGPDMEFFAPSSFDKDTCLPLLNIGQMLEILQRRNFNHFNVYFIGSTGEKTFTLGRDPSFWENYEEATEEAEPCDVIWEAFKALL